jgi:3-oxoacyl-[acyl-carrier-protein] synthase-3
MVQDDVDLWIFHQANKFMLNTIRKVCVLPKDKFYVNLNETGNTVSSTVMIGLKQCLDAGTITPGMKVMVAGFGVGLSWGGTILRFR